MNAAVLPREADPARLSVPELKAALHDGQELALVDVRDAGAWTGGHLLFAVNAPFARLELVIGRLVPRLSTRVVLVDEREEVAHQAAERLRQAGYSNVAVLSGGTSAWAKAGYEVWIGRNTPGAAFGEVVEHEVQTPNISAVDLQKRFARGDVVLLDTRPRDEFENQRIPGALLCAGTELAYRVHALGLAPDTLVAVNCGGRTRAILGAQSLINLGIANPVAAVTGGTMEWLIANFAVERGPGKEAPHPGPEAIVLAREAAVRLAKAESIRSIDAATLKRFESEQATRTLYRFDVRTTEEYLAGHLPGWRSTPDGELFARIVKYIGTRGARVVLYDSAGVRDVLTASWLQQQGGFDVYVLEDRDAPLLEIGPEQQTILQPSGLPPAGSAAPWIDATTLNRVRLEGVVTVFDVELSTAYRRKHLAGAQFAQRYKLSEQRLPEGLIVVTSSDGVLARIVATELRTKTGRDVRALLGGTKRWVASGLPVESGGLTDTIADDWVGPGASAIEERNRKFREYLDWELSLVDQIRRDGDAPIRVHSHS